jgi:penicillin-binding protein 1C
MSSKRLRRAALIALPFLAAALAYAFCPKPPLLETTSFSTAYFDRHGTMLRLNLAEDEKFRLYATLEHMSPDLIKSTLEQEDRYFYTHPGVNPFAILRAAFETYVIRKRAMGGSTISMQVVRLRDHMNTRGVGGKIIQIAKALQLERHYSKNQILEAYLNLAPYGGNIEGAEAAALIYYHQSANRLALPQSIGLAVIPQNPVKRFPLGKNNLEWAEAQLRLFERLPESAKIYEKEMRLPQSVWKRDDLPFMAPHFVNGLGRTQNQSIETTLDFPLQKLIESRVKNWLARERGQGLDNAAVMLIHAPSMEVRALLGSGDFFNAQTHGQVDGTQAYRSPGSTLKPFIYALGIEQGLIHPETLLADDPESFSEYKPANFDNRFIGMIPAREALVLSRNVPAIALASKLENPNFYDFLQNAGASLPEDQWHYGLSIAVGGAEVNMRTLIQLYAMLANGGVLQDLKFTKDQNTKTPRNMLSPEAALLTLSMLERPNPEAPLFTSERSALPVYWKTGTSSGFRDAWTVGIFGPYVLAVWIGHFDGRPSPALVGVEAAAPLFFELQDAIEQKENLHDLVHPALEKLNIASLSLCNQSKTPLTCTPDKKGWFIPGKSPFIAEKADAKRLEILSPRTGFSYVSNDKSGPIPLEAKNLNDQEPAYWFANNTLIGEALEKSPLFWTPNPGHHVIRLIDAQGRSASQEIKVIASD